MKDCSSRLMWRGIFCLGCIGFASGAALGQLRVAEWNVTNYSGGRFPEFQTAIFGEFEGRSMAPDILITQEFLSAAAVNSFLTMLNTAPGSPGDWAAAPFIDGNDTDNAAFYRTSKVVYSGKTRIATGGAPPNHPRDVNRYDFMPVGYESAATMLACYSSHMKSGTSGEDQARRLLEAERIRADARTLPPDWNFLIAGDFNMQSSAQAAYQELVGVAGDPAGQFFDPINTPGSWNNTAAYRFVHTQDPVGAGGMDDRHDQILISAGLRDNDGVHYIGTASQPYSSSSWDDPNHSYRCWGNDGTSYNGPLTVAGNTMVGPVIAQALRDTALTGGHLPVFLDLRVPAEINSEVLLDFGTFAVDEPAFAVLNVENAGDVALWTAAGIDDLEYSLATSDPLFTTQAGPFFAAAGAGANLHVVFFDTSTAGAYSATLTIASNAPDEPARLVTLQAVVHGPPLIGDLNCDGFVSVADIGPFVIAITDPVGYAAQFPSCNIENADINGDEFVTVADIGPFVGLLVGP